MKTSSTKPKYLDFTLGVFKFFKEMQLVSSRDFDILHKVWFEGKTRKEVATEYELSNTMISGICQNVSRKMYIQITKLPLLQK